MSQLYTDCLSEIFEYLENDQFTLNSCILVSRFWCEISVRIFWRNVWNYSTSNFSTLIACLPNESKEILYENGIIISALTSKYPSFNYAAFCKILSINRVHQKLQQFLKNQQSISSRNLENYLNLVTQEILKLFVKQIPSLKKLAAVWPKHVHITSYPGAKDCLKYLSELHCSSNINSELF